MADERCSRNLDAGRVTILVRFRQHDAAALGIDALPVQSQALHVRDKFVPKPSQNPPVSSHEPEVNMNVRMPLMTTSESHAAESAPVADNGLVSVLPKVVPGPPDTSRTWLTTTWVISASATWQATH